MATKETKLAVYRSIKDNLDRRFEALKEGKNNPNEFFLSQNSYFKYVNENIIVARSIKQIILEDRLYKPEMREIFNASVLVPGFKNEKVKNCQLSTPLFWNEELEKRFGLRKKFINMMKPVKGELVSSTKNYNSSKVIDLPEGLINDKYALRMMSIIRKLHNDIMEILDENIVIIKSNNEDENDDRRERNKEGLPFVEIKKIDGYFRLNGKAKGIWIGKKDDRRFRLLQALCVPSFGAQVKSDIIWGYIEQPKDDYDNDLKDSYERPKKITSRIDATMKELRKKKYGLQGKVKFNHNEYKTVYWLTLSEY
jgi:hypothetical protein